MIKVLGMILTGGSILALTLTVIVNSQNPTDAPKLLGVFLVEIILIYFGMLMVKGK